MTRVFARARTCVIHRRPNTAVCSAACKKCEANTEANVGLWYIRWNELPGNMDSSCAGETGCLREKVNECFHQLLLLLI